MKIAHIVCAFPPYYSGMGNVVFQTANELMNLGHEVMVYTPDHYEKKEIKDYVETEEAKHAPELQERVDYVKKLAPSIQYGNAARLPQIKDELDGYDIVHLHYPFYGTAELVSKWKKRNPEKPLVVTYHMDNRGSGLFGLFFKIYGKIWLPKILRGADAVVASSFDFLRASDAAFIYSERKNKCFEIPFGVDTERFAPREKPVEFFKNLQLDMCAPTVLFVGGMDHAHYFKGVPVLLKSLILLKNRGCRLQAIFVGEGDLRSQYESSADAYGLKDSVRFVGSASEDDLPLCYNMADLLVLPSIHSGEAFGMVLLEAMASGVPVIASDLQGVRSVAMEGGSTFQSGSWLDLAGKIEEYFAHPALKEEWGQKARSVVEEKFSWPKVTKELEKIYFQLIK